MSTEFLNTDPNFEDADAFYAALTEAHRTLDAKDSERLNARLALLLAYHIGDGKVLAEALDVASELEPI